MNANANIVKMEKGTSNLVRPRFSPGLLLRDDDLRTGVDYTRELSRLLFRSLFGCGVVCGLEVSAEMLCGKLVVTVKSGVALNGAGDPIYVPKNTTITVDPTCGGEIPDNIWVILCRTEKCCAPRSTVCGCEEEESASVCTREQEGFEIRLVKAKPEDCACMCPLLPIPEPPGEKDQQQQKQQQGECWCVDPCGCQKDHYAGTCGCNCCDADCKCCDPDCVVLSVLTDTARDTRYQNNKVGKDAAAKGNSWIPNHSVRRFVRPVLMRDPVVYREQTYDLNPCKKTEPPPPPPPAPPPTPPAEIAEAAVVVAAAESTELPQGDAASAAGKKRAAVKKTEPAPKKA
jgi:hypothetical protein